MLLTPVFRYLPQAALGAVVLVAAVRMIDIGALRRLWTARRSDFVLAAATMVGVLIVGVLPGIAVGVAVSLLEVLRRAILPPTAVLGRVAGGLTWRGRADGDDGDLLREPGLLVYRFDAPLFFANAELFHDSVISALRRSGVPVSRVVIAAEPITDLDSTAADMLASLDFELAQQGVDLAFAELRDPMKDRLRSFGFVEQIGHEKFFLTLGQAVRSYVEEYDVEWLDWEDRLLASG
jgi:SulP family sulfate permease